MAVAATAAAAATSPENAAAAAAAAADAKEAAEETRRGAPPEVRACVVYGSAALFSSPRDTPWRSPKRFMISCADKATQTAPY